MADVDVVLNDHLSVGVDDGPHTANRLESKCCLNFLKMLLVKIHSIQYFLKSPPSVEF